jgi:Arc/MetJ family transcription regulator
MTHIVCMKRTNIMVDRELLEKARSVIGERTYSATITKALQEVVRVHDLKRLIAEFAVANKDGAMLNRDYVEEMWPESAALIWPRKQRASADELRAPKKQVKRRGAR